MSSGNIDIEFGEAFVRVHARGPIDAADISHALATLKAHDDDAPTGRLWDLRQADVTALKGLDVDNLADLTRRLLGPPRRIALLVATDLQYGLTRMFTALHGDKPGVSFGVFRDEDEAIAWLAGR